MEVGCKMEVGCGGVHLDEGDADAVCVAHVCHLISEHLADLHRVPQRVAHAVEARHLVFDERQLDRQHDWGHL